MFIFCRLGPKYKIKKMIEIVVINFLDLPFNMFISSIMESNDNIFVIGSRRECLWVSTLRKVHEELLQNATQGDWRFGKC